MFAISLFILAGCGIGSQNTDKQANDSVSSEMSLSPEALNLLYSLPTPFEVTTLLEQAKAGYIFDITNPVDNVGKYITEKDKAINLGIYSADLAYAATYNQVDNTNQFLGCTSKLAGELGIAGIYHPNLVERIKRFDNNKDSLVDLVSGIFLTTNDFLSKNNRNQVAVYIATGAFVEGLFLTSALNIVAVDNTQISGIIFNQTDNYEQLMSVLDLYKHDIAMKALYDAMLNLKPVFTDFSQEPGKQLDAKQANAINDMIEGVRDSFID
ncbi:MAG: hypothetical protein D4R67_04035 [Bacteroidetes bacterium]|nr:MAG: hypothetical protein D4R67_04035 [Bacteroidota bacterium]